MSAEDHYARFVAERAQPPPLTSGDTFHWDGMGAASRSVGHTYVSEPTVCAACLDLQPKAGDRASPAASTRPVYLLSSALAPAIDWAKEAARLTLYLDPELLLAPPPNRLPETTGVLMWLHGHGEYLTPAMHPALLVQTAHTSLQVGCSELVLHLPIHDPLQYHIALALQAAVDAEGEEGQLYAEALADAFTVHFLRRYAAAQPARREVTCGLPPYKLRRAFTYIQAHLEEKLSVEMLAAVTQMSPAHFAHQFKHATGLAPHQYINLCRIKHAKRLLAETDMPLIEISAQVGCADQSHFTALFRRHVAMTPNAYRSTTRGTFHKSWSNLFSPGQREALMACSSPV
jgi:AraC-like DNA-binding protein